MLRRGHRHHRHPRPKRGAEEAPKAGCEGFYSESQSRVIQMATRDVLADDVDVRDPQGKTALLDAGFKCEFDGGKKAAKAICLKPA